MDTLRSNTTKPFNILLPINEIARIYRTNKFPDAYCLLTPSFEDVRGLSTENRELISTENRKVVLVNGQRIY